MKSPLAIQANSKVNSIKSYKEEVPIIKLFQDPKIRGFIKLANNENQLGASPRVLATLKSTTYNIHHYPDDSGFDLKIALAKHWNIMTNQLTLGAGSNQLLWLIAKTFAEPGDEVLISQYSFSSYYYATLDAGALPVIIPISNWNYDLKAMLNSITSKTKLIYIANPNNPTGSWINQQGLASFLQLVPEHILVVIDEAYYEYIIESTFPDTLALQKKFPNVIITRTFSKAYGLAGLRIGYSISHPNIAGLLDKVRDVFNVSSQALIAAQSALEDREHIELSRNINQQGLNQLKIGFDNLSISYLSPVANFITIYLGRSALEIYQLLLKKGIIVCPLNNYDLPCYLRITVGTMEQNAFLLESLQFILSNNLELILT
jgi:histidinol-phosphate aminotransferase